MDNSVDEAQKTHIRTSTGVHLPKFFLEPQSLSSKKDREKRNLRYMPPAPRPHHVRSAPSQSRLIHSRIGNDSHELDNSFHLLMAGAANGTSTSFFRTNFEIQERLGFGSFGDVFRVKSKIDQKEYAVKKSRRVYTGEADRARQLREVLRMTNIPSNAHVVELETAWEEDGHLFFQMELCSRSLNQDIEEGHTITESDAWDVMVDMMFALQHLHKNLLVHMDVKPDNIFLTIDTPTRYKLGDFGIIVCLKEKRDVSEFTEGDSRYLAPEVMQGVVTTKADVFSLGLTILEIACHVDLPKGGTLWHQLRNGEFPEPSNRTIPASLEPILKKMLTHDLSGRPEIEDLMNIPYVRDHINKRKRVIRLAWFKNRLGVVFRVWTAFMSFIAALLLFRVKKDERPVDLCRSTPEPYIQDREVPNIVVNESSFSDDEEGRNTRTATPVYASTPISHSKTKSTGRLRSSRLNRLAADGEGRPVGSPTSRNLLKEFEAVSD